MSNIQGRLKKAELAARRSHPEQFMCFFRPDPYHSEIQSEAEVKWRKENPNFEGKIYVYTIGARNM
jgi:hypothetical protein